jgi:hypothetical protein
VPVTLSVTGTMVWSQHSAMAHLQVVWCALGVDTRSLSSWSYQRLVSLTTVQGLCQARAPCDGLGHGWQDRVGGHRGGDVAAKRRVRPHHGAKATRPAGWRHAHMWAPLEAGRRGRGLLDQAYRINPCMVSNAMVSIVLCMQRAHWRTK